MKITCPGCGASGNLNNPEQGRSITCPKCQLSFKLGTKAENIEESPLEKRGVKRPHTFLVFCVLVIFIVTVIVAINSPPLMETEAERDIRENCIDRRGKLLMQDDKDRILSTVNELVKTKDFHTELKNIPFLDYMGLMTSVIIQTHKENGYLYSRLQVYRVIIRYYLSQWIG